MLRRGLSLFVVLVMMVSLFTGFSGNAQAAENKNKTTTVSTEKALKDLQAEAKKYDVDIKGLSIKDATAKILAQKNLMNTLQNEAKKYGVDITGLSAEAAKAKIVEARKLKEEQELKDNAQKLGIDISGLSNADAWEVIKNAQTKAKELAKLPELIEKAKSLGIDLTGLTYEEAKAKFDKALSESQETGTIDLTTFKTIMNALTSGNVSDAEKEAYLKALQSEASALGIDVTGLSLTDAIKKVKESLNGMYTLNTSSNETDIYQMFINLVVAVKLNDKASALKIVKSEAFTSSKDFSELTTKPYNEVKKIITEFLKKDLNIDISKVTVEQLKATLTAAFAQSLKEEAAFYGVDTTGLTDAQIRIQLEAAKKIHYLKEMIEVQKYADAYNVDITGLSKEDAWKKVKDAMLAKELQILQSEAASAGVDIKGLSSEAAWKAVKLAENKKWYVIMMDEARSLGLDVSAYSDSAKVIANDEMMKKLKELINGARDAKEANGLLEQAKRIGVDITGLTPEAADQKIMEAYATKYGVDITGLSRDAAWKLIKEAEMKLKEQQNIDGQKVTDPSNDEANLQGLLQEAANYGVDITGLSQEDAQNKIRQAKAAFEGIDITGLSPAEADAKIDAAKNNQMAPDAIFLQQVASKLGLNTQAIPSVMRSEIGKALGIDLTGLTPEAEQQVVTEKLAAKGIVL